MQPDRSSGTGSATGPQVNAASTAEHVVHVVGEVTCSVMSFLEPTTATLAVAGFRQSVVSVDLPRHRPMLDRLSQHADLVLVQQGRHVLQDGHRLLQVLVAHLRRHPGATLHVHGFLPALVGALALRRAGASVPMVYSPHGSRSLGLSRRMGARLLRLLQPMAGRLPVSSAIASCRAEPPQLDWIKPAPVHLAESPIPLQFLATEHAERARPMIVSGSLDDSLQAAECVARLAVLLGDEVVNAELMWLGPASPQAADLLRAAAVRLVDGTDTVPQAALLASAWMFVAPTPAHHLPLLLAQAMAAGLACVAVDSPFHRALLRHDDTGLLCASDAELIDCITALLDSPALRQRLGQAARREAGVRFDGTRFAQSLLGAYAERRDRRPALSTPLSTQPGTVP